MTPLLVAAKPRRADVNGGMVTDPAVRAKRRVMDLLQRRPSGIQVPP